MAVLVLVVVVAVVVCWCSWHWCLWRVLGWWEGPHLPPPAAGTNVDLGKKLLSESGIKVTTADDLDDAAKKAVTAISK